MKIIGLEAENVKRIKAVSIKPDGSVIEITGKNGEGKTSLLDCIWWALADARHIQEVPIRKGQSKAHIKLDLGKLKVTRKFRAAKTGDDYTTSIVVENEEGARFGSPQSMLDELVGALSFDPLEFTRMKAAAQFDACRRFVPDFDFEANAGKRKTAFEKRTETNRDAKELRAQADGVRIDESAKGLLEVDEAALVAELEKAGQHNADIEARRGRREQAARDISDLEDKAQAKLDEDKAVDEEIKRLLAKREQLNADAKRLVNEAHALQEKLDAAGALPAPIDTALLTAQIAAARETNQKLSAAQAAAARKLELTKKASAAEKAAETLTEEIAAIDKAKQTAIASAKMPVPGLSFGDDVVLLDGLPLNQASGAAQLRLSCAIAAAFNPKLRVLRVKDGALLDADSMKLLQDFAEANDMQVWVETVSSGRPGAVVIVDGMVEGAEPPETKADETEAA